MTGKEFEDYALAVALDRYGVIASLVTRVMEKEERAREVQRIAGALHKFQSVGQEKRVSERTVSRWASWYQHGHRTEKGVWVCGPGLDALKPTRRSDCGLARVLTPELVERAVQLRKEEEARSARTIVELIQGEYKDRNEEPPLIEEHTLARHLRQQGVSRRDLAREPRTYPRYEQAYRNATWQGDWTQGFAIPDPVNPDRKRMTHLHAFLDDHSRYIVHGEFYFRQNLPCLEDCFRKAILKGGIPERTYWDNGAVYQSRQIQLVAGRLGVQVVFATPYHPQGKGKIERWFKTCQDAFFPEARRAGLQTLDELNAFFWGWLERGYHDREHSELKATPRDRWEAGAHRVRLPAPGSLVDLFLWEETRLVDKTGCVSLQNNRYAVGEHLVGRKVEVRFDPFDLARVRIYVDGAFVETAEPVNLTSQTFRKALPRRVEKPVPLESSEAYRNRLSASYRRSVDATVARLRQGGKASGFLSRAELAELLRQSLGGRVLTPPEDALLADFFGRNAPLLAESVRAALRRAVEDKGLQRHLRFYLDAIRDGRLEGGKP